MSDGDVVVWTARLSNWEHRVSQFLTLLSRDEVERADRLRLPTLRTRYITGRGLVRLILAQRLSSEPEELIFRYTPQGKPELSGSRDIHFNVSHSGDIMVCAITSLGVVGIDVEQVREGIDRERITRHQFSSSEIQELGASSEIRQFFCCWTRKEAFLKATGDGLSRSLKSFAVSCAPDKPARLLRISEPYDEVAAWHLESFEPAPEYIGAVALRRVKPTVCYLSFDLDQAKSLGYISSGNRG